MCKKKLVISIVVLTVVLFAQMVYAGTDTWKITGDWNYTYTMDGEYEGHSGSLVEHGIIRVSVHEINGQEYIYGFGINGDGTVQTDEVKESYSYEDIVPFNPERLYTPGREFSYSFYTDFLDRWVRCEINLLQHQENEISGSVTFWVGEEIFRGTLKGSRPDSGSSGGCNTGATALLIMGFIPLVFCNKRK